MKKIGLFILPFATLIISKTSFAHPQDDEEERLEELEEREERLNRRVRELERRSDELDEATAHRTFGIGTGLGMPSDWRYSSRFALEANLQYLFGNYYLSAGGALGLNTLIEVWRLKFRPLGIGVFWGGGEEFTVSEISRSWDVMLRTCLDIRIWRGLELRGELQWFFPSPGAVFRYAEREADKAYKEGDSAREIGRTSWRTLRESYGDVFWTPVAYMGARWEF